MRIVLDTNVLLSGLFFGGVPLRVVEACFEETVELVVTPEIWAEYQEAGLDLAETKP